jgi:hypothetical protein
LNQETIMKRLVLTAVAALTLLLGGCATTIRSDVTTFHQWPSAPLDKTYVFEAPPAQDDTLELRSYQNLVRGELAKLGFQDAGANGKPTLTVSMRFSTADVPERVIMMNDPFYLSSARFGFYRPGYNRFWGGYYSPFYDPFWYGGPSYHETVRHNYQRELQVAIKSAADGKRLFDVTVHNSSRQLSTPAVMPALVQSAFEGFPGPNGAARRIDLKQNNG